MLNTFENNMKRNGDVLLVWYQKTTSTTYNVLHCKQQLSNK